MSTWYELFDFRVTLYRMTLTRSTVSIIPTWSLGPSRRHRSSRVDSCLAPFECSTDSGQSQDEGFVG